MAKAATSLSERVSLAIGAPTEAPYADGRGDESLPPLTLDGTASAEAVNDQVGDSQERNDEEIRSDANLLLDRVAPPVRTETSETEFKQPVEPRRAQGTSSPRRARAVDEPLVKIEVWVPESVSNRMKSKSRPLNTGAERFLGANFVAQGLLQAAWDLAADHLDMRGLDKGREDEMVSRAKKALLAARRNLDS